MTQRQRTNEADHWALPSHRSTAQMKLNHCLLLGHSLPRHLSSVFHSHTRCVWSRTAEDATHFFCILYFNPCGSEAVNLKLWFILSPSFVCGVPLGRRLWSEHLGCVCQEVDAVDASGGHLWKFPLFKFGNCYSFISPAAKKKTKVYGGVFLQIKYSQTPGEKLLSGLQD